MAGDPIKKIAARLATQLLPLDHTAPRIEDLRPAAVLILIHVNLGEPGLLFTKRSELVASHRGQISFPGGGYEEGDDDLGSTALRETEEEIGLARDIVTLIGQLSDQRSISNYQVFPFVGTISLPFETSHDPREVDQVIEAPLSVLLNPMTFTGGTREINGRTVPTYSYEYDRHVIWGLTGRILREFLKILDGDAVPAQDRSTPPQRR